MGFMEAVGTCLSKIMSGEGRARRSEYWWFMLFVVILSVIVGLILSMAGLDEKMSSLVVEILTDLLLVAVTVRRLHDIGKSGWFYLIQLIPLAGGIILLVFTLRNSQPGRNQYGPNPKGE